MAAPQFDEVKIQFSKFNNNKHLLSNNNVLCPTPIYLFLPQRRENCKIKDSKNESTKI